MYHDHYLGDKDADSSIVCDVRGERPAPARGGGGVTQRPTIPPAGLHARVSSHHPHLLFGGAPQAGAPASTNRLRTHPQEVVDTHQQQTTTCCVLPWLRVVVVMTTCHDESCNTRIPFTIRCSGNDTKPRQCIVTRRVVVSVLTCHDVFN